MQFRAAVEIAVIDPVPDLQRGNGVITDSETLAKLGRLVSDGSADSANRVVLRLKSNFVGERLKITILNDSGQPSASVLEDGGVGPIGGGGQSVYQLTSVRTSRGPMAFAMYRPPANFSRAGRDDSAADRKIWFRVESLNSQPLSRPQRFDW